MSHPTHIILPWPEDGSPADFETLTSGIKGAIKSAYQMRRRRRKGDVSYKGLDIGQHEKACCLRPNQALTAQSLAYNKEDQGRDALDVILGLAIQLGIEQGRRVTQEKVNERLRLIKVVMADHPQAKMLDLLD